MMRLHLARHPDYLDTKNQRIIEDLQALVREGKQEAVNTLVLMLKDLHENGEKSRFIKALKGLPILELKSASRGGQKGGARVYFFYADNGAVICNCEVKDDESASREKLREVLKIMKAHDKGIKVF
jgi:hypothetical protein